MDQDTKQWIDRLFTEFDELKKEVKFEREKNMSIINDKFNSMNHKIRRFERFLVIIFISATTGTLGTNWDTILNFINVAIVDPINYISYIVNFIV